MLLSGFPTSDPGLFTHRGLVWELQQKLLLKFAQSLQPAQTLVLIIDGADKLVDRNGQLISDWIPKSLPRRVHLVLSVSSDSGLDAAAAGKAGFKPAIVPAPCH